MPRAKLLGNNMSPEYFMGAPAPGAPVLPTPLYTYVHTSNICKVMYNYTYVVQALL